MFERWLNEAKNRRQNVQITESNSTQRYANLCPSLSFIPDSREMDNFAEPQLSCDSIILSSAEPVSSSHNMHVPSENPNCDMEDVESNTNN